MATKTVYPIGDFRYGTRMMRAGDSPIPMSAPDARLYLALGKVSLTKPKVAPKLDETLRSEVETVATPKPAAKPARKRATRRKK